VRTNNTSIRKHDFALVLQTVGSLAMNLLFILHERTIRLRMAGFRSGRSRCWCVGVRNHVCRALLSTL